MATIPIRVFVLSVALPTFPGINYENVRLFLETFPNTHFPVNVNGYIQAGSGPVLAATRASTIWVTDSSRYFRENDSDPYLELGDLLRKILTEAASA
ncbi:MAG TPA: hypothetical protein VNG90_04465 [Candidatus Acidoferrum sp.]|nr:hypothetical protein [Candidatus Acidoferrum sp.]